jgi:N-acetylglutamate synthase-like GNAT family acetyltransferase
MDVKKLDPSEWTQLSQFLDQQLRAQVQWSLHDEYPLAFSEKNRNNIHIIKEKDRVVAHAVVHPSMIKTHYHLFKVGLIGSVVTDSAKRGQGLSRNLLKKCLQTCEDSGCDLAMLWTDLFNFYAKFGFEMAGSEIALQVDASYQPEIKTSVKVIEGSQVSTEALLKIYNQHNLRSIRTAKDIEKFLNIPQTEVYSAWNQQTNAIEAYCIVGKGADFTNYVHEWGGGVIALQTLLKHIQTKKQAVVTLITPPQCQNLIKSMQAAGAKKYFGVLGMIAIINPLSFCKKIKKGARALGYQDFIFEYRDAQYYFGYGHEVYQTDSAQDIVRLVFGPAKPEQIHSFSEKALGALKDIFPIPFWVWGWDSI